MRSLNLTKDQSDDMIINSKTSDRFWPKSRKYNVHSLILEYKNHILSDEIMRFIFEVSRKADAIRDLQDIELTVDVAKQIDNLKKMSAANLERIASLLSDEASAKAIKLRALALLDGNLKNYTDEILLQDEAVISAVCGNLGTWHAKSMNLFHSAYFALVDNDADNLIKEADSFLLKITHELRAFLGHDIEIQEPPLFKVANLIDCGGEANRYPKHFSHFLPEDEGIKYNKVKKTILFKNVYLELIRRISLPGAREHLVCTGYDAGFEHSMLSNHVLLWFRGHDIGHGVRLPNTDFKLLSRVGRWFSMEVQEVLADCFGFIFCMLPPWKDRFSVDLSSLVFLFLSEMLRYLRRAGDYPDAGAAYIELIFFYKNGVIDIDFKERKIFYSTEGIYNCMLDLAKSICDSILSGEPEKIDRFFYEYSRDENSEFSREFEYCFQKSFDVVDYSRRDLLQEKKW